MSRARIEVPQLENMVGAGKKKFVRYAEGMFPGRRISERSQKRKKFSMKPRHRG